MAAPKGAAASRKKRKVIHGNQMKRWLLTKQKIEVRSMEDGFLGSWHRGEVVGCGKTRLRVKYEEIVSDNASGRFVEWVPASPVLCGSVTKNQTMKSHYRGNVRPLPPEVDLQRWSLHYGRCVDLNYRGAWWEGVIFDHEDGCKRRKVFFPDMGDEMTVCIKDLRVTQDWDEVTGKWKPRGDWLLLELIEEAEQEWPILVSVKQIWYDLRVNLGFQNHLMEWTSNSRHTWKEILYEVVLNNLKFTVKHFLELNEVEDMEQEAPPVQELSEPAINVVQTPEAFSDDALAIVPCGSDSLFKKPTCVSDTAHPMVGQEIEPMDKQDSLAKRSNLDGPLAEMDIEANCLPLDEQDSFHGRKNERNNLNNHVINSDGTGCVSPSTLSVLLPMDDHASSTVSDSPNRECSLVSLEKPSRIPKHATGRTRLNWLPSGPDIVPAAECCPGAVTDYIKHHRSKSKGSATARLKARKHLSYLGWKILSAIDDGNITRVQYISPTNKIYYSLLTACLTMQPESAIISSNFEAKGEDGVGASDSLIAFPCSGKKQSYTMQSELISNHEVIDVESSYCPQAVVDYSLSDKLKDADRNRKGANSMISKAKRHLAAIGWRFSIYRKRGRAQMRYIAPSGQIFYSLTRACKFSMRNSNKPTGEIVKAPTLSSSSLEFGQVIDLYSMPSFPEQPSEQVGRKLQCSDKLQRKRKRGRPRRICALAPQNCRNNELLLSGKRKSWGSIKQRDDVNAEYSRCVLRSRQEINSSSKQTPRTILSCLIDSNVVLTGARVYYGGRKNIQPIKEGRVTREGIKCICCLNVFTPTTFQAHAGSSGNRPSTNIFLEDGRTLLECQMQLKHGNSTISEKCSTKSRRLLSTNDHVCSFCHYGGKLVLCDGCPSSFHANCIGLEEVPYGDWFCPLCCCGICKNRVRHFAESSMDEPLRCDQCEQQYHIDCLTRKGLRKFDGHPEGNWFCNKKCQQIHISLKKLLGKRIPVGLDNLTWTWLKYTKSVDSDKGNQHSEELMENYGKLNVALSVMHECFEPVKDPLTRRDLVEDVLFNRRSDLQRLNFQGFYTVLLERDEELITVATVRIHGDKVAEIPLIATRFQFRRQGMCRALMDAIEKKLLELGVHTLVLPAAPGVLKTWTTSFGFSTMTESERYKFMRCIFLGFQGTVMCQKRVTGIPALSSGAQRRARYKIRRRDSVDVERNNAVPEVLRPDQMEGSEMVDQGSEGGIGCKSGDASATSEVTVDHPHQLERNEISKGYSIEVIHNRDSQKAGTGLIIRCKRRKLSTW